MGVYLESAHFDSSMVSRRKHYATLSLLQNHPSLASLAFAEYYYRSSPLKQLFSLGLTSEELIDLVNQNAILE